MPSNGEGSTERLTGFRRGECSDTATILLFLGPSPSSHYCSKCPSYLFVRPSCTVLLGFLQEKKGLEPSTELYGMSLPIRGRITLNFPISFLYYSLSICCCPLLKIRTRVGCSRPLARSHTADCVFMLQRIINTSLCCSPPFVCFTAPFPEAKRGKKKKQPRDLVGNSHIGC